MIDHESHEICVQIGAAGIAAIRETLQREFGSDEILDVRGKGFQRNGGDLIAPQRDGHARVIEVKTEEKETGNIFYEDWSDYLVTPGWTINLKCQTLAYYFIDSDCLYLFDWQPLRSWVMGMGPNAFVRREQGKYVQRNLTTGYLVSYARIATALGYVQIKVSTGERTEYSAATIESRGVPKESRTEPREGWNDRKAADKARAERESGRRLL